MQGTRTRSRTNSQRPGTVVRNRLRGPRAGRLFARIPDPRFKITGPDEKPGQLNPEFRLLAYEIPVKWGLAGLESRFCEIRNNKLVNVEPLDDSDRMVLCAFTAAMFLRTPAIRDHWQAQWREAYEIGEQMMQVVERTPVEERHRMAASSLPSSDDRQSLSHEQVKALMEQPLQQMLIPFVPSQSRWFMRMSLVVLRATDDVGFITSDSPCVWFDAEAHKRPSPYNHPGLGYKTVEVTLPVSPSRALLFSWSDVHGYADANNPDGMDEINRRTRSHCDEYFVVQRNVTTPEWFKFGKRAEAE